MNKNFKLVALIFFVCSNVYLSASYVRQFLSVRTPESAVQERLNGLIANEWVAEKLALESTNGNEKWRAEQFIILQASKYADFLGLQRLYESEASTDGEVLFLRKITDVILKKYRISPQRIALKYSPDKVLSVFVVGPIRGLEDVRSGEKSIYSASLYDHYMSVSSGAADRVREKNYSVGVMLAHEGAHLGLGHLVSRALLCGEIGKAMGVSVDASDAVIRAQEKTADRWAAGWNYPIAEKCWEHYKNEFDKCINLIDEHHDRKELIDDLSKMKKAHEYDAAWNSFKKDKRFYLPYKENDRRGVNSWKNYREGILSRGSVEKLVF